uniref:Uncharacterized protein n=1 Tax=Arundo donax TaxID=35708 RepID=A0A0A9F0Z2_ARUDO
MLHLISGNGGKVTSSFRGMGFLIGSDMQANGKLVISFDICGSNFIMNCIRPETILCRRQNAMLTMVPMLQFPCVGKRKAFAVAVEVVGVSAFFTVVSLSPELLSDVNTPTPRLPGRWLAQRPPSPTPRPW